VNDADTRTSGGTRFEAAAFHPRFGEKRDTGTLLLLADRLRYEGSSDPVDLPFNGLTVRSGGASDRLIFFTHLEAPGWSIYTSDRTVLVVLRATGHAEILGALRHIQRRRSRGLWITGMVLGGVAFALVALWSTRGVLVEAAADRVPLSIDERIGAVAMSQITLTRKVIDDPQVVTPLREIVRSLEGAIDAPAPTFKLFVVEDETLNAFALPGGNILVNTGLIRRAASADEIAGVLAHEIAHVTERHSIRNLIGSVGLFVVVQAMLGDVSGLVAIIADGGSTLLSTGFSRDFEREADEVGLGYLAEARIDPAGMVSFFRKMLQEEKTAIELPDAVEQTLSFLSTHPTTEERIERLQRRIDRLKVPEGGYQTIDIDLERVKAALNGTSSPEPTPE